jgi:hypothetical protein
MWDKSFLGKGLICGLAFPVGHVELRLSLRVTAVFLLLVAAANPSPGREKDVVQYGEGLIVNIPLPEPEVAQVVEDVAQNTIIRGTKEYDKDEFVQGSGRGHVDAGFSGMDGGRQGFLQSA